jgi:hypothetical protein
MVPKWPGERSLLLRFSQDSALLVLSVVLQGLHPPLSLLSRTKTSFLREGASETLICVLTTSSLPVEAVILRSATTLWLAYEIYLWHLFQIVISSFETLRKEDAYSIPQLSKVSLYTIHLSLLDRCGPASYGTSSTHVGSFRELEHVPQPSSVGQLAPTSFHQFLCHPLLHTYDYKALGYSFSLSQKKREFGAPWI